ncbi:hypothetical protein [Methylobacterium gnaphalii]|uniref:Uncharacterized protein n=1 Tax=Methylobacterium gnaphalii TaxID=1010610 RepID=A0A512JSA1_9HYPH|nr:hypothetical protein [Methylobacterium gnaphalii]GEP12826.1 hypothetical protein MGN01_46710 [Methylobacterium gnaphalii]GJD71362.1 hypothetical protein MMMDOFMJ_4318 [Methylobacterium gnaphalii]GLS50640.1 hypothetical protein GCM10007885_34930 [Methylobacterium gnaphalii]
MTRAKKLVRTLIDDVEGGFQITLETDDGQIMRVQATEEQLEDLADEIEGALSDDDEDDATANAEEVTTEEQPS